MVEPTQNVKDIPIPNSVNEAVIKQRIASDNFVTQFAKEGTKLLENTNKPNIITVEQFLPYISLFNTDKDLYETDPNYKSKMTQLYSQYIRELGINLYEPTLVIRSKEDQTIEVFLQRRFTRIAADNTDGRSFRDTVPGAVSKAASATRDQLILDASIRDLVEANKTDSQMDYFRRIRKESAFIEAQFLKRNMSPEKRDAILSEQNISASALASEGGPTPSDSQPLITLLDDDD